MPSKKTVKWGMAHTKTYTASQSPDWKRAIPSKPMTEERRSVSERLGAYIQKLEAYTYKEIEEIVQICGDAVVNVRGTSILENIIIGSVLQVFLRVLDSNDDILEKIIGTKIDMPSLKTDIVREAIRADVIRNTLANSGTKSKPKQALRIAKEIIRSISDITADILMNLFAISKT